jgi:hypothetical protein
LFTSGLSEPIPLQNGQNTSNEKAKEHQNNNPEFRGIKDFYRSGMDGLF